MRPKLLDLFCGAGGCAMGYHRAGFDVVGVDIKTQPNYPFEFIKADALEVLASGDLHFDAVHASPPCQANIRGLVAVNKARGRKPKHADLIPETRKLLEDLGVPFVIENVEGSSLFSPMVLCGTSFGLPVRRHRLFESNVAMIGPPCDHDRFKVKRYYSSFGQVRGQPPRMGSVVVQIYGNPSNAAKSEWGPAMGIDWMNWRELAQAIPPAYTEFIGKQLLRIIAQSNIPASP